MCLHLISILHMFYHLNNWSFEICIQYIYILKNMKYSFLILHTFCLKCLKILQLFQSLFPDLSGILKIKRKRK